MKINIKNLVIKGVNINIPLDKIKCDNLIFGLNEGMSLLEFVKEFDLEDASVGIDKMSDYIKYTNETGFVLHTLEIELLKTIKGKCKDITNM